MLEYIFFKFSSLLFTLFSVFLCAKPLCWRLRPLCKSLIIILFCSVLFLVVQRAVTFYEIMHTTNILFLLLKWVRGEQINKQRNCFNEAQNCWWWRQNNIKWSRWFYTTIMQRWAELCSRSTRLLSFNLKSVALSDVELLPQTVTISFMWTNRFTPTHTHTVQ